MASLILETVSVHLATGWPFSFGLLEFHSASLGLSNKTDLKKSHDITHAVDSLCGPDTEESPCVGR